MISPQTAQSSQSFVRALKAPSDPPQPDGSHKVEIAREAWDDTSFYVPSKEEVIADWLLTKLLKDKAKELSNPILDLRYWTLLADIISLTDLQVQNAKSRPQKTWLKPLLNRIPIAPIVLAFISLLHTLSNADRLSLTPVVKQCLAILWPLGIQKATSDTLLECFGGVLKLSKEDDDICGNDSLANIGEMVTASFSIAFENASNKKKIHQTFVQTHLLNWLECTRHLSAASSTQQSHLSNLYITGTNILFAVDMLRQSQTQSTSASIDILHTNLKSLLLGHSPQVLSALPRLFASFIQSVRKHRGTLFSQSPPSTVSGANTEAEVRKTAMAFFVSCMVLVDEAGDSDRTMVWKTRVHLLDIVDKEALFRSAGARMEDKVLRTCGEVAIKAVASASQDNETGWTRLAITVLSTLIRIDYGLIAPSVPQILSALLFVSEETEALAFLDLLLDYHTKTRTMHTYISTVLSVVSSPSYSSQARKAYTAAFSSPLLHLVHLDRLSKYTNNFLTLGQTHGTMTGVLDTLKHTWDVFWEAQQSVTANSGEGSRKKRKLAAEGLLSAKADDPDVLVVAFALTARISSIALSSLPLQSLPASMRSDVRQTLVGAQSSFIQSTLQRTFKMIGRNLLDPKGDAWACQVGTASTLRLEYTLISARHLGIGAEIDENVFATMLDVVGDDGALPELSLEIFRSLLNSLESSTHSHKVLESLLRYLERSPVATSWSGSSCQLSFGKSGQEQTALALIRLLIDKWLPAIDLFASQQHLERFSRLIMDMRSDFPAKTREGCRPSAIFNQTLRSAQFWELVNTRDALLSLINEETSCLAIIDQLETQTVMLSEKPLISQNQLQQAIAAYELLLYVPIEYVPKASRLDLIRRALAADLALCQTARGDTDSQRNFVRSVTILRVFLTRWFSLQSSMDHATIRLYAQHLITSSQGSAEITYELLSATLDLFGLHISVLLRSSDPAILEIISSFSAAATCESSAAETWGSHIVPLGITRFLRLVTAEFLTSDFSDTILSCMKSLHGTLFSTIDPRMSMIVSEDIPLDHILGQSDILQVWCHVISFGRWLHAEGSPSPFGKRLIAKIASANHSLVASSTDHLQLEKLCSGSLAILLEEMHHYPESSRLSHLDVVIATYVYLGRISDSNEWHKFDLLLSKSCKGLPVVDFSHMLDLCWVSLSGDSSPKDLTCLIHLSTLLLHHAPQGTLKVIQRFTTHVINLIVSCPMFYSGSLSLRLGVLDFVAQHCSDRPAALRSLDHSSIWSLLSKLLGGSKQHDPTTSTAIFYHIVSIISSIIRLRRDLVVCTLPHLGMILRQLIMVMRHLRPRLGAKQSKMVTDTFPVWINGGHPLAAEEGRALARMLTTLTSKTIVRTHQSLADSQKAESLAKPFSKHAAYVLKSYVDAMNDPLCVMPLDIRKELQPGLFSLCDMISEHSRDAMMVSALDAGGKATMKALWKEHEKQRYVGKG